MSRKRPSQAPALRASPQSGPHPPGRLLREEHRWIQAECPRRPVRGAATLRAGAIRPYPPHGKDKEKHRWMPGAVVTGAWGTGPMC
jgi:hypothetical protein